MYISKSTYSLRDDFFQVGQPNEKEFFQINNLREYSDNADEDDLEYMTTYLRFDS